MPRTRRARQPNGRPDLIALLRLQELAAPKRQDVSMMSNEELDERIERLHRKIYGEGQVPAG